jgi:outer membrane protein, heavy metal efflux system
LGSMKRARPVYTLLIFTAACAPVQRYHPQPLAPSATAAQLASRTLADPGLRKFVEKNLGKPLNSWPLETWDVNQLALAAYYFNPQMEVARAQAEAAQAAIITAGQRPNPTLSLAPGIPSPYLLGLDLLFPVLTAGKRGLMVDQAKALRAAAQFGLAATAWRVRSSVRAAALDYVSSLRRSEIFESEARLRSQEVQWLSERLTAGEVARPEVEAARVALMNTRLALRTVEGRIPEARTALAAAIGVPVSALEGIKFTWQAFDHPLDPAKLPPQIIQREAVLNRLDVRQSLAEYEAAQAVLQLEIARQHPDFSIGPGYQLEERDNFFTLSFSTVLPLFNRNQGPIAQAEARRKQAAASFLMTQANAIAQSEQALARYRTAFSVLEEARRSVSQVQKVQEPMALQAVSFGESDKLFLDSIQLQGAAAVAAQLTALYDTQVALGQLEDAVERPLASSELPPPAMNSASQGKEHP